MKFHTRQARAENFKLTHYPEIVESPEDSIMNILGFFLLAKEPTKRIDGIGRILRTSLSDVRK